MAKAYSDDLRCKLLTAYDRGQGSLRELAELFSVSCMDLSKFKMPDLSKEDVTPADLIAGMRQIIDRAHEHGIKVNGATMTPFEGADYFSDGGEATRQSVNQWIRTGGAFDGVIDFDVAVRDPAHPTRFREGYHSGDFLHPNDTGYKAMADAIDITVFKHGN